MRCEVIDDGFIMTFKFLSIRSQELKSETPFSRTQSCVWRN